MATGAEGGAGADVERGRHSHHARREDARGLSPPGWRMSIVRGDNDHNLFSRDDTFLCATHPREVSKTRFDNLGVICVAPAGSMPVGSRPQVRPSKPSVMTTFSPVMPIDDKLVCFLHARGVSNVKHRDPFRPTTRRNVESRPGRVARSSWCDLRNVCLICIPCSGVSGGRGSEPRSDCGRHVHRHRHHRVRPPSALQRYLAHSKLPPPWDHSRALGMVLLYVPWEGGGVNERSNPV